MPDLREVLDEGFEATTPLVIDTEPGFSPQHGGQTVACWDGGTYKVLNVARETVDGDLFWVEFPCGAIIASGYGTPSVPIVCDGQTLARPGNTPKEFWVSDGGAWVQIV